MLSDYITPGDRLEITVAGVENDEELHLDSNDGEFDIHKSYRTRVYDIMTEDMISVEMPMEKTKLILLPVGGNFDLCFYTRKGLYQCYATVHDRYKSNNIYILEMELTTNLRKFQRREYYRFSCILEMQCRKLNPDEEKKLFNHEVEFIDTDITLEDGLIVDISGGGARFVSDNSYGQGEFILFKFTLDIDGKKREYNLVGQVVLSAKPEGKENYENRIKFVNIDDRERESIIKYIFEEERKLRNRKIEDSSIQQQ